MYGEHCTESSNLSLSAMIFRRIARQCASLIYKAFLRSDRSAWVPRNGASRTPSGPEGSSGKRIVSCAAGAPGGCGPTLKRNNQRRQYAILFRVPPLFNWGRENSMAQKKVYAVKKGRSTGLFASWDECRAQIDGFAGAIYKGFASPQEAQAWLFGSEPMTMSSLFDDEPPKKSPAREKTVRAEAQPADLPPADYVVYTDGSCLKNPDGTFRRRTLDDEQPHGASRGDRGASRAARPRSCRFLHGQPIHEERVHKILAPKLETKRMADGNGRSGEKPRPLARARRGIPAPHRAVPLGQGARGQPLE